MAVVSKIHMSLFNLTAMSDRYADKSLNSISRVDIMYTPEEIKWEALSQWAIIPAMSRNNPHYHYTGGEDTLTFMLDWYAFDSAREEALKRASIVKSWSRANAYSNRPPAILLYMGGLFTNHRWVIKSANYSMSLFMKPNYVPRHTLSSGNGTNQRVVEATAENRIMPVQIHQELVLYKVTSKNESLHDMYSNDLPTQLTF